MVINSLKTVGMMLERREGQKRVASRLTHTDDIDAVFAWFKKIGQSTMVIICDALEEDLLYFGHEPDQASWDDWLAGASWSLREASHLVWLSNDCCVVFVLKLLRGATHSLLRRHCRIGSWLLFEGAHWGPVKLCSFFLVCKALLPAS